MDYHYIQWHDWDNKAERAGKQVAVELYDHQVDPDENVNISELEKNQAVIGDLSEEMRQSRATNYFKKLPE